jgi:hypothetical protein
LFTLTAQPFRMDGRGAGMGRMFEEWGEGRTLQAAAAFAIVACGVAAALGAGAERFAERQLALAGPASEAVVFHPPLNTIDFATTGSIQGESKKGLVVLGPCGER